ncbi:RPA12/RPB9/RPC11 RNA polymerase family protein [Halosegnis marinus]|uniref:RPA12/RPB9/RPC11 RNA polymerase family protein n=1 Tax=Halosegnis marinus TaxID=3034023 RepID=A0ABD5ZQI0_9EURY|nr:DNA-directed RNA polymerase subunit M [Halosegnis sp. DT85]
MRFCDECDSMMHAEGGTWTCRACGNEAPRDAADESGMTTTEGQRTDERSRAVGEGDGDAEAVPKDCPAEDCDGDRARYGTMPKPGGSYEVRLFTCVACGHKWREA